MILKKYFAQYDKYLCRYFERLKVALPSTSAIITSNLWDYFCLLHKNHLKYQRFQ